MRKTLQFVSQALATFVLVAGAAVVLLGVLVPAVTGATTYAVLADSMAPRYPKGTLMVVRERQTISTGDVITFQVEPNDPTVVTHRVIGIGSTMDGQLRFTTQGDANAIADPMRVAPEQIRGVMWYSIPFAGYLVVITDGWREYAKLGAAALLAGYAGWQIVRFASERKEMRRKKTIAPVVGQFEQLAADVEVALADLQPAPRATGEVPMVVRTPVPVVTARLVSADRAIEVEQPTEKLQVAAVTIASNSFTPTMTRAERRKREAEFALIS